MIDYQAFLPLLFMTQHPTASLVDKVIENDNSMIAQSPDEGEIWGLHSLKEPLESAAVCGYEGVPVCGCVCVRSTYVTS